MSDIKPIRTDADHTAALREIEALWGAQQGTPDGDRLDVLIELVHGYEEKQFAFPKVEPVALVKAVMAERGLVQKDLAKVLASPSRASEFLAGKRGLSVEHIRSLRQAWGIPADALI